MKHSQLNMLRQRILLTTTALVWVLAPTADAQHRLDTVMQDTVLGNGLHVVVVPNPTIPLATIQVTIRNGAFTQESPRDVGMSHMLEHMLFRSFDGGRGFARSASDLNASYNGTTSDETVTYFVTLPSQNVAKGMQLMGDLMDRPRFDREHLKTEKDVVRGELERRATDPEWLLSTLVDQELWGGGFDRKNTIGTVPAIMGATAERLQEIYERFYVPNNTAVVITGDVTAAAVFPLAAKHFGKWKRGDDPFVSFAVPPMPPLAGNKQVITPIETNDITLLVKWQGPSVRQDRAAAYSADLFAAIISDPVSDAYSRLIDTGLFQSLSTQPFTRAHVGEFSIQAVTTADQLVAASAALRAEIDLFTKPGYVTSELLDIAKKRQEVQWALAMESPFGLARFVGDLWSVAGLDYARGYLEAIKSQQTTDLERFATTYLGGKPRVIGVMLSPMTGHHLGAKLQQSLAPWR
jgi:zinc protease